MNPTINTPKLPEGYYFKFGPQEGRLYIRDLSGASGEHYIHSKTPGVALYHEQDRRFRWIQKLFGKRITRVSYRNTNLSKTSVERTMSALASELRTSLQAGDFDFQRNYQGKKLR